MNMARTNPFKISSDLNEREALMEIVKKLEWVASAEDYMGMWSDVLNLRDAVIEYLKEKGIWEGDE